MIEVVTVTPLTEAEFQRAPTGQTLARMLADKRLVPRITFGNLAPLATVYNARIEASDDADILVFVHDDVWIADFYFPDRVIEGLKTFDVIGVAGCRIRLPGQTKWWTPQSSWLAGAISHGNSPLARIDVFGPRTAECELLDGVFLAARKSALVGHNVRFDPKFAFHLYDLDFCRSARAAGLKLGTWPIAMTHNSKGAYASEEWRQAAAAYLAKWQE